MKRFFDKDNQGFGETLPPRTQKESRWGLIVCAFATGLILGYSWHWGSVETHPDLYPTVEVAYGGEQ